MLGRKLLLVAAISLLTACFAVSAAAEVSVDFLGQYYGVFGGTPFRLAIQDDGSPVAGTAGFFKGENLWNTTYLAGWGYIPSLDTYGPLVITNVLGLGQANSNWPPNVYEVRAYSAPYPELDWGGGEVQETLQPSLPAAVTIISPNWGGVFAGGTTTLSKIIDSPLHWAPTVPRQATLGFIDTIPGLHPKPKSVPLGPVLIPQGDRDEFLFLDPEAIGFGWNEQGEWGQLWTKSTKVASDQFKTWFSPGPTMQTATMGYCDFQQVTKAPNGDVIDAVSQTYQFDLLLTLKPNGPWLAPTQSYYLKVYTIPYRVLYEASGTVANGKVEFRLP